MDGRLSSTKSRYPLLVYDGELGYLENYSTHVAVETIEVDPPADIAAYTFAGTMQPRTRLVTRPTLATTNKSHVRAQALKRCRHIPDEPSRNLKDQQIRQHNPVGCICCPGSVIIRSNGNSSRLPHKQLVFLYVN